MEETATGALVRKNLALMDREREGGMRNLLNTESIGGTGGRLPDLRTCNTANYYFDRQTGEIILFNNPQYVPTGIQERYGEGKFKIANAFPHLPKHKGLPREEIIESLYDDGKRASYAMDAAPGVSADAKRVLRLTVETFNAMHR